MWKSSLIVACSFILSSIFAIDQSHGFVYECSRGFIFMLFPLSLLLPRKYLIYLVLIVMVNMLDLTQSATDLMKFGYVRRASLWQQAIGPIPPSMTVFALMIIIGFRLLRVKLDLLYKLVLIYFCGIMVVISFYHGYPSQNLSRFISDLKIPIFLCLGSLVFISYFTHYSHKLHDIAKFFLLLCIGHFLLDFINHINGTSVSITSGFKNASLDSTKGLVMAISFYAFYNIAVVKRVFPNTILFVISVYMLIAFQTRWLILTLSAGIFLIFLYFRFYRKLFIVGVTVLTAWISMFFVDFASVEEVRIMLLRFNVARADYWKNLDSVDPIRFKAIVNSISFLNQKDSLLQGLGYGSWYDDRFIRMPKLTVEAFTKESLIAGKFYRVHEFFSNTIFKTGLIGLVLYLTLFLRPITFLFKRRKYVLSVNRFAVTTIVIMGLFPTILTYFWFSAKALLFTAFYVVFIHFWALYIRRQYFISKNTNTSLPALS